MTDPENGNAPENDGAPKNDNAPENDGAPENDDPPAGVDANDIGLSANLLQLASVVAGVVDLAELLAQVAAFAVKAIPGADGAGVIALRVAGDDSRIEASAASADFVREIDKLQYDVLHEGPGITAAAERRTVRSGSLGGAPIWPRFGPRVGRRGVHSALSLPLLLPDQVVGAINVYARAKHVFDDDAVRSGELFARPAAVAAHNGRMMAHAQILTRQLQSALQSRPVIDQAIGLIRGRTGVSAEEALARLKEISQHEHTKLVVVAQRLVDEAVRRAHPRHDRGEVRARLDLG